jgi:serine/threonine protein kinase
MIFCLNIVFVFRELPPHPNVVQLYGVCVDGPQLVIVLEYCPGGKAKQLRNQQNQINKEICDCDCD